MKFKQTRLQKIEERKNFRQAIFLLVITIFFIIGIFIVGIPLAIKISIFLANRHPTNQQTDKTQIPPPPQPQLRPLPQATNSADLVISGFAPEGNQIKIFLNDEFIRETATDKNGEFNIPRLVLKEGENKIRVISFSEDKESEPYTTVVVYKKTPPQVYIESPSENQSFFDKDKEITVKGKTDSNTTVTVNGHLAIVDSEGIFRIKLELQEGENQIKVIAQDEAGNTTELERKVSYAP
jgi:hypothetical protein